MTHPTPKLEQNDRFQTRSILLSTDPKEFAMASNVVVRSVTGERFTQVIESGKHHLYADEPETVGGTDRGPGPYEYLLAALGA